ncbi:hypothetical protein P879_03010 [Paragonimus westermani]|uniref:Uncharacterized protein n=1 Tax=Paragonimus westermani TaxID=34504 RepID=A0A8T0D2S4_9TREM|nr:hypothetical protein P879_03010 [Paragonimus westermani]
MASPAIVVHHPGPNDSGVQEPEQLLTLQTRHKLVHDNFRNWVFPDKFIPSYTPNSLSAPIQPLEIFAGISATSECESTCSFSNLRGFYFYISKVDNTSKLQHHLRDP